MARIRTIKPTFFTSRSVKKLSDRQKLVWIGLWPNADDHGRLLDEPGILAGSLWSLSLTERQIDTVIGQLHDAERLIRYVIAGESYIQITNWEEHQRIQKPSDSLIPPVALPEGSGSPTGALPDGYHLEGKGKERRGGEAPPAPHCGKHPGGTDKPCKACGDARRTFEAWQITEKKKPTTTTPRRIKPSECSHPQKLVVDGVCMACEARI